MGGWGNGVCGDGDGDEEGRGRWEERRFNIHVLIGVSWGGNLHVQRDLRAGVAYIFCLLSTVYCRLRIRIFGHGYLGTFPWVGRHIAFSSKAIGFASAGLMMNLDIRILALALEVMRYDLSND